MTTDKDAPAAGLVEALNALNRADQFISNGIEFGFIRMPDAPTPDPADETPDIIRAAIAKLSAALQAPQEAGVESIETYFARQIEWSGNTFGPALRTKGVIDHIRKELMEIEAEPHDLSEWIDVVILAMDGFWRHGGSAADLLPRLLAKQAKNMARTWPDWRTLSEDSAIEHDRSGEGLSQPVATPAPQEEEFQGFITCVSGDGDPYVKVKFRDLAQAHAFHDALLRAIPTMMGSPTPAPRPQLGTIPNYPEYDNARIK